MQRRGDAMVAVDHDAATARCVRMIGSSGRFSRIRALIVLHAGLVEAVDWNTQGNFSKRYGPRMVIEHAEGAHRCLPRFKSEVELNAPRSVLSFFTSAAERRPKAGRRNSAMPTASRTIMTTPSR